MLKGSTARGNADRYSDIDLVFFTSSRTKQEIVSGYRRYGLCNRSDGIFMFFENGHYHVETYDQLKGYYLQRDFIHCWEFEHAIPLWDPEKRFGKAVAQGKRGLFRNPERLIRRAYLDLQLDLDWMRMPIVRADAIATFLHAAKITQGVCRIAYLLDGRSYPPDKWIARYLSTTRLGQRNASAIRRYVRSMPRLSKLQKHQPFAQNPLYEEADALIKGVAKFIKRHYGDHPWLVRWYEYV